MSDYDYQERINARAVQNRASEEYRANLAAEADRAHQIAVLAQRRRRALRRLCIRLGLAVAVFVATVLAVKFQLVDSRLAVVFECATLVWAAVWFGAWLQLRYSKEGGLLE